jgi:peptide/nickel transport system substrate-binding protein
VSLLLAALLSLAPASRAAAQGTPSGPTPAATPASALVVGLIAEPLSLDPHRATDLVSAAVVANVCEGLVRLRQDGSRPEAALATTWATIDNRAWTFTLREGVRFHDGAPFDAEAVVRNLENVRQVRGFPGRAERLGPHVVQITLEKPNAALLATLSQPFYSLQSPRAIGGGRHPVGTGPFRFDEWSAGGVRLSANPDYWGGAPRLAQVLFRRYADEDALADALVAGRVDVTAAIGQRRLDALRGRPGLALDSQTGLNIALLSLNNERAPFTDARVRQAIARAVDRPALVARILGGHGEPARNPLPPSLWGYDTHSKELDRDLPAARRLLAEAGKAQGFDTTLMAVDSPRPYLPSPLKVAALVQAALAEAGIRARIVEAPSWPEYLRRGSDGDYDMALYGWQADSTDPNDFLSALLASESVGATNRSRFRSPSMDALLKRGRMASGSEERRAIYQETQRLFRREMPWVPLYHVSVFTAYNRSIQGLALGPTGVIRYDKAWKTP